MAGIDALRDHWLQIDAREVDGEIPYYTLGVGVTYVRHRRYRKDRIEDYAVAVAATRPLLQARFAPLYRKLADHLGTLLGASVVYDKRFGLPGFHICMANPYCTRPLSPFHIDTQYMYLPYPGASDVDFDACVSVTLPRSCPPPEPGSISTTPAWRMSPVLITGRLRKC